MSFSSEWIALVVLGVCLWLLVRRTTAEGARKAKMGGDMADTPPSESPQPGTSIDQDHEFLLSRCNGDEAELFRRLEAETRRNPRLGEAEVYRKAIRTWFVEKRGGTHGAIAEELDDTWL